MSSWNDAPPDYDYLLWITPYFISLMAQRTPEQFIGQKIISKEIVSFLRWGKSYKEIK